MPDMTVTEKHRCQSGRKHVAVMAVLVSTLLAGCSQVPDAVNPVEWYNSSVDFFSGDDQKAEQTQEMTGQPQKTAASDANQQFPNLASVERSKQLDDVRTSGLVADVEGRKYAPAIARQGEAVNALNAPPAKPPVPTITAAVTPTPLPAAAVAPTPQVQPTQPSLPASPAVAVTSTQVAAVPATDDLSTTRGQQDFQATMAQRLAEIRAHAAQSAKLPSLAVQSASSGLGDTIVISADGIQSGYGAAASTPVLPVNRDVGFIQRAVRPMARGAVKVATIMFKNGSARLSARDRSILADVRKLQQERGGRLRVIGHSSSRTRNTDPLRHKMINLKVSTARADAVAKQLLKFGLDKSALQVDAVSDSAPVYFEFMPTGEAGNRRAEIFLES